MNKLNNNYNPQNLEKVKEKSETLNSAKKLFYIRKNIRAFKRGTFPYFRKRIRTKIRRRIKRIRRKQMF